MSNSQWRERARPARLERRYDFADFEQLRDFLDGAADLSEAVGYYPDMGFGRDYVNVVIYPNEGSAEVDDAQREFAHRLDQLYPTLPAAA
jgi:4a-hydroxytetrahydrobiopterin dehydratase